MEDAALSILQRAPPGDLEKNLQGVSEILAQQQDNAAVEQVALIKSNRSHYVVPFRVYQPPPPLSDDDANKKKKEEEEEKPFLQCQYNRVGDHQYRSPWTNRLYPPTHGKKDDDDDLTTATTTTTTMAKNTTTETTTTTTTTTSNEQESELRLLEVTTNEVWDSYKKLYYGANATGSVFLRPLLSSNKQGNNNNNNNNSYSKAFKGLFGIYKPMAEEEEEAETLTTTATSSWHSVSIVQVEEPGEETCVYKVDTTVLVALNSRSDTKSSSSATAVAELDWDSSALVSKSVIKECKIQPRILSTSHIENLGQLIEANEMELRSSLERVQMPKLVETVDALLKRKKKSFKPAVNPIMGMIMDSDILKRKKSTTGVTADPAVDSSDDNKSDQAAAAATATATTTTSNSRSSAPPKNHMMGMVMNSDELKQKLAKQAAGGD